MAFTRSFRRLAAASAVIAANLAAAPGALANPLFKHTIPDSDCRHTIEAVELDHGIPTQLLSAISLAEAGRWDARREAQITWPWTVYAEGRGRYLPTKDAAIAEVKALRAKGVRNIDVGCMQVNLHYHSKAFDNLEEAFDPRSNAEYAARFLTDLHGKHRSWSQAVAHYHSSTRDLNRPYRHRVLRFWHEERRRVNALRVAEARAKFLERRAKYRQTASRDEGTASSAN
jgi:hypothetical protein